MIYQLFNSSIVSGPEKLVFPALNKIESNGGIIFLKEERIEADSFKPKEYADSLNLKSIVIPVHSRFDRTAIEKLRQIIIENQISILHAHDVKASFYAYLAIKDMLQKPKLVSTHHGIHGRPDLKTKLFELFYSLFVLKKFDCTIAVSQSDYHELLKRGIKKNKLECLINGIQGFVESDLETKRKKELIRKEWASLKISKDSFVFGVVARLSKEKRHDRMIQIIKILKDKGKDVIILFFGVGAEKENLEKQVKELHIENSVRFMGYSESIVDLLPAFDALMIMSDAEGLPINLLEAGYAKLPVVATSVGGIPSVIRHKLEGLLVDPKASNLEIANQIEHEFFTNQEYLIWGKNLALKVETQFSISRWTKELNTIYKKVLSNE